jgi:Tol biopolymer transport system component
MNADGSDQTNLTKSEPHEGSPAWSPDGKRILFDVIGGAAIFLMNSDGTGRTNLTRNAGGNGTPAWRPAKRS